MTCRHCGRAEAEHHEYEPLIVLPPGCKCDPNDWRWGAVAPICGTYDHCAWMGYCINCGHERACHNEGG